MSQHTRAPLLHEIYQRYLVDQDTSAFAHQVGRRYTTGTLERLAAGGDRMARRAAVMSLGILGDYSSNASLGRSLQDSDRGVRMLAENGIRNLWCRVGSIQQQQKLGAIITLNNDQHFQEAVEQASRLLEQAPWMAEAWNQRALALFSIGRFAESIRDCNQALEINPYHFGAAAGMGQCHMQLKNPTSALECFRRALKLNPNLEGVRAHVLYLQRTLKGQE